MSSAPSPEWLGRTAGLSALGPCEQTAPIPGPQKEAPPQGYQTERRTIPPAPNMSIPARNVDVRRRCSDPFTVGIVVGAIAATIGFVMGMIYVLLS